MKRKWLLSLILLVIASALIGVVSVSALAGYNLDWWTVDGGGGTLSTGGRYVLGGSIGQPDAGTSSGGTYTLAGGFWSGNAAGLANTFTSYPSSNDNIPAIERCLYWHKSAT